MLSDSDIQGFRARTVAAKRSGGSIGGSRRRKASNNALVTPENLRRWLGYEPKSLIDLFV